MDDTKIEEMLDEQIERLIDDINRMEPGTKEHSAATEDLTKLYRCKIENERDIVDSNEKFDRRMMEVKKNEKEFDLKKETAKNERIDRWIGIVVQAGLQLLGFGAYAWFQGREMKFEETGTIRSSREKNLMSRVFPKFK